MGPLDKKVIHDYSRPTINDEFPNLEGATQDTDDFSLYDYLGNDNSTWAIIFMHPGDFTPVCTTELGCAAQLQPEFEERNVKLVGFSCNDAESHRAWIDDIYAATGQRVNFPLFCDPTREVSEWLGILDRDNRDDKGLPLTVRSVYILNPQKVVSLVITYPASTGRNFDEILRVVDALQLTAQHSVATPCNWKQGERVIVNFPLSDKQAEETFGKDGFDIVDLPSEKNKELSKHYLRYTKDPSSSS